MGTITAQVQTHRSGAEAAPTLVYQECGMFFDERRSPLSERSFAATAQSLPELDSFYAYYRLLTSREGRAELALLLENLTVNETSFFRNRRAA